MWPMLLNLTGDECRRTLRRLELEAYSNMMSVFRAQGSLEDNRKKMLEELRAVLHISNDRHSAEARRVANDELLATIAEQIAGPNTGLGWLREGRRKIPLMPRGIPQTAYTEIADKAAEEAAAENREIKKKQQAEKLVAPKTSEAEGQTAESALLPNNEVNNFTYPTVAMEDQVTKLWETELFCRKRKLPEGGAIPDDMSTPVKNIRNIPVNTNQKHLNLSQIYSKFSQPTTSKSLGQTKHSYNQVSKVSTSKSNQSHTSRSHKPRKSSKNSAQIVISKSQMKKSQGLLSSPSKSYNPTSLHLDYTGPPSTFQASYAQSVLGNKNKHDYIDKMKPEMLSSPSMIADSPTMQLLTQPATLPHEFSVSDNSPPEDESSLQAQSITVSKQTVAGKACHLIIKRGETTTENKVPMSEVKLLQKPVEGIKLLTNRQVVVASSSTQKALNTTGKLVTTKVMGSMPKSQSSAPTIISDKMFVVSNTLTEVKTSTPKIFITSPTNISQSKDVLSVSTSDVSSKSTETLTPKGIPATDLKVSAKTFVLKPKAGKMVMVPAKGPEGHVPIINFKGVPTTMKLVPVSCQAIAQITKTPPFSVVSKATIVNPVSLTTKIVGVESIKTANMADIVPIKGVVPTPKISNPISRPASGKGVIVVQKGTTIGKALTFAKNGSDMSKIIMGKNVNQLLQASKPNQSEATKTPGNVIVLELNNDQLGRTTTMSEILESRDSNARVSEENQKASQQITQSTPVLFDTQITEEICNTSSLDSATESIGDILPIEESTLTVIEKEAKTSFSKNLEGDKDTSSVTDWEIELETVTRKGKDDDDKLNSLHLDLGMSSESDSEYIVSSHKSKSKHSSQESLQGAASSVEGAEIYSSSSLSLATRTLLSQLQDEGSSSNDSSFVLKSKIIEKSKEGHPKLDKSESEELTKAKEKLSEKVAEAKSQQKRIDVYSTAISSSEINLESFSYLDDNLMAGDDDYTNEDSKTREERRLATMDEQFNRLLAEDSANSTDSQTVSDDITLDKNEQ